jgi:CheY-like chemotaxis protein
MSHEIRTPMNVVVGLSDILGRTKPLTARQQEFIRTLQVSAESLLSIINDLLDLSKIETQTFELEKIPFSLEEIIDGVVSLMAVKAQEKGLDFVTDLSDIQGKQFIGDPTRVRQILLNLCGNAVKFTEKGGIVLKVRSFHRFATDYEDLSISISDTGIGIPREKLDFIFEKFTQADSSISRKYGGTGLGLAITRTFVEMMNGKIHVESVYGEGTTFTVFLPMPVRTGAAAPAATPQPLEKSAPPPAPVNGAGRRPRVLLVEDYKPNAMVACEYLGQFGFDYDVAENGHDALEKIRHVDYHAVLMDIQMSGLDGYRVTRAIREHERKSGGQYAKHVRIIGMTAHALTGIREKCLEAGMDDYMSKPFNPQDLKEKLAV